MSIQDLPADTRDIPRTWVSVLRARGVTVTLRGNRLELRPANAYKALSDTELLTLRHHREAIKQVVRDTPVEPTPACGQTAALAPRVEPPCPHCYESPCVGHEHPAFATLHALDEPEQWRRRAEQREQDNQEWELRQRYGPPSPTWG